MDNSQSPILVPVNTKTGIPGQCQSSQYDGFKSHVYKSGVFEHTTQNRPYTNLAFMLTNIGNTNLSPLVHSKNRGFNCFSDIEHRTNGAIYQKQGYINYNVSYSSVSCTNGNYYDTKCFCINIHLPVYGRLVTLFVTIRTVELNNLTQSEGCFINITNYIVSNVLDSPNGYGFKLRVESSRKKENGNYTKLPLCVTYQVQETCLNTNQVSYISPRNNFLIFKSVDNYSAKKLPILSGLKRFNDFTDIASIKNMLDTCNMVRVEPIDLGAIHDTIQISDQDCRDLLSAPRSFDDILSDTVGSSIEYNNGPICHGDNQDISVRSFLELMNVENCACDTPPNDMTYTLEEGRDCEMHDVYEPAVPVTAFSCMTLTFKVTDDIIPHFTNSNVNNNTNIVTIPYDSNCGAGFIWGRICANDVINTKGGCMVKSFTGKKNARAGGETNKLLAFQKESSDPFNGPRLSRDQGEFLVSEIDDDLDLLYTHKTTNNRKETSRVNDLVGTVRCYEWDYVDNISCQITSFDKDRFQQQIRDCQRFVVTIIINT